MSKMRVANTILEQLGGRRFLAMTGAKNLIGTDDSLIFMLPYRNGKTPNKVVITLMPSDTYRVEFAIVRGGQALLLSMHDDIYCDALAELFERQTGLRTSLGTMGRAANV
jgi:hypothetical protein